MIPGREYSVSSVLRLVRHSLPIIAALAAVGAIGAWLYVREVPDRYRSSATIIVQAQLVPQAFVKTTINQGLDELLRAMGGRVLSPEQLGRIATEVGLTETMPQTAAIQQLAASINVAVVRADAFRVSVVHENPVIAAKAAQRIAQAFVDENMRTRATLAGETEGFMESQLERTRAQLEEHERRLEQFRRTYAGQLPSQLSSNLQGIQNAQVQLRGVQETIQQERDRKLRLDQMMAEIGDSARDTEATAATTAPAEPLKDFDPLKDSVLPLRGREALQQLPRVEASLRSLQLQLKPDHPDIVRLKRVVAELRQRVIDDLGPDALDRPTQRTRSVQLSNEQRERALQPLREEAAALGERLAKREAEEQELLAEIDAYQRRVELIPTRETELTNLMRDYDSLRETYQGLLAKKQESQMASDLEKHNVGESFKIVEAARVAASPFEPRRAMTTLAGAGVGLALAILIAGWREFRDDTLRTEREITQGLGVPVIAFLPVVTSPRDVWRGRAGLAVVTVSGAALVLLALWMRAAGQW